MSRNVYMQVPSTLCLRYRSNNLLLAATIELHLESQI